MATAIKDKLCSAYPSACSMQPDNNDYKIRHYKSSACILNMDKIARVSAHKKPRVSGKRCDDLVAFDVDHEKTGLYVIEKKSQRIIVDKVVEQLKGGTKFVKDFVEQHSELDNQPCDFMPVLVSDKISFSIREKLRRTRVSLRISGRSIKKKRIRHVQRRNPLPAFQQ